MAQNSRMFSHIRMYTFMYVFTYVLGNVELGYNCSTGIDIFLNSHIEIHIGRTFTCIFTQIHMHMQFSHIYMCVHIYD